MDDLLKTFLTELKAGLSGFPESETREAVEYYEEYINDALEEGENPETVLSRLDPPEKIAAVIMTETSIKKAQSKPGLKNYSKVLKYSRTLITRPFSILLFFIFIFMTYSTALLLFLGSVASVVAACFVLLCTLFEGLKIRMEFVSEIIGFTGFGIFSSALCLLSAIALFKLCRCIIKLSTSLVSYMLNKPGKKLTDSEKTGRIKPSKTNEVIEGSAKQSLKKTGSKNLSLKVFLVITAGGLVISFLSGLPVKLFMIFNSMEPSSVITREWEYNKNDTKNISITTAHSHIRLEKGSSDKIKISYEQPDWMEPEISCTNGQLSFVEKSNGRLPLFPMVSMHENNTDVVLTLPQGFAPQALKLESRGGFIYIGTGDYSTQIKTYTGSIYVEKNAAMDAGIKAATSTGVIQANGKDVGTKTTDGIRYEAGSITYAASANTIKAIEIETSQGSIFID